MFNFQTVVKTLRIYAIAVAVIVVVLIYLIVSQHGRNKVLSDQIKRDLSNLKRVSKTDMGVPSQETVQLLADRVDKLKKLYVKTLKTVSVKYELLPVFKPLEFKEELLKIEKEMERIAVDKGILLGSDIGFAAYKGGRIPTLEQMPLLTQQLFMVKDLLTMCFDSDIKKINGIELVEVKQEKDDFAIYESVQIKLDVIARFDSLVKFMDMLYTRPEVIWINTFSLEKATKNSTSSMLRAKLGVEIVKHKENVAVAAESEKDEA